MSDQRHRVRVVVITALGLEYQAVRSLLTDPHSITHPAGTIFETGTVPGSAEPFRIALAVTGEGSQVAAVLVERAQAAFRPDAVFVVGVAGALHDDIALGDVVVATRVYDHHGGTEEGEDFRARPRVWTAPHHLEQLARQLAMAGWAPPPLPGTPTRPRVQVHFKPVAAGDILLNSRTSSLAQRIRRHYSDAVAIEMESAGAAHAAHLNESVPLLTIRGISDRADGRKVAADAAGWQVTAARHAAAFAVALAGRIASAAPAGAGPAGVPEVGPAPDPAGGARPGAVVLNAWAAGNGTVYQAAGDQHINRP
jgi:nucleoside phosphorylase